DVRDDGLARRLADRPGGRGEGRGQPPVARDVQRGERVAGRGARGGHRRPVRGGGDARVVRPAPQDDRADAERDPGRGVPEPEGAFYAYPSVKELLGKELRGKRPQTSVELAALILEEAEVALVPGEAFGTPGYFRLSYA